MQRLEYEEPDRIYPTLPSAPEGEVHIIERTAHMYRLQKISEIQKEIATERDKREALSKKYHRAVKVVGGIDSTLVATSIGLGVAGIGVLSIIIGTPVVIAMESIIGSQVNKKLSLKAEKHGNIKTLADAKLNMISDHISKALKDDMISDEEYTLILSELEKFNSMKEEMRGKIKIGLDEETKQSLIAKGR